MSESLTSAASSAAVSFTSRLVACHSVSSCLSAATPPLPPALVHFSLDYPITASALTLVCVLSLLAWLLQDMREEVTRLMLGKGKGSKQPKHDTQQVEAAAITASPVTRTPTTASQHDPQNSTQVEPYGDTSSHNGDSNEWRLQQQQQSQQHRSSSPSQLTQQQQQQLTTTQHNTVHNRHRGMHEQDRDRDRSDREWRGYDRHERVDRDRDRDRDREQPRRRSRYEDEGDDTAYTAGGGYSYHSRGERDREERERAGREAYREKEVRRRPRDRDGHSSAHYGNADGRPSLSPTHPVHPSLSLPSPGHRHHQSFSSLHSHVPPSPSQASFYPTDLSSTSSVYESSVSSLPSASMLSSGASFSQLSSPSHAGGEVSRRPSPVSVSTSPSVVVIGEADFLWTLARGCELVKYGHYGSPHVRWFQIEVLHGVCRLSWGERRTASSTSGQPSLHLTKSIKLDDILDVRPGKQTAVFKQSRNDKIATDEQCCFSIITQKRSLDLQAKDRQQRDEWVNGLRETLMDRQHGSQQQKLILAASAAATSSATTAVAAGQQV